MSPVAASPWSSWIERRAGLLAGAVLLGAVAAIVSTWPRVSATWDERAHIESGLEWLERGSYSISLENPPLSRLPLAVGPYLRGYRLDEESGGRPITDLIDSEDRWALGLARVGVLPFFVLAGLMVFVWARRLHGSRAALAATGLYACAPPVLAHAGVATTDMPFTAVFLVLVYAWTRWLDRPAPGRTALLGVALGTGLATKFTSLAIFPAALLIVLLRRAAGAPLPSVREIARRLPLLGIAAFGVIWAAYRFALSPPLALDDAQAKRLLISVHECAPAESIRGVLVALAKIPMPAPRFFEGWMALCAHEARGHVAYLLGSTSPHGFVAYYPVALVVKSPIGFLALGLGGVVLLLRRGLPRSAPALAPAAAAAALVLTCMVGGINMGVRHVLPFYPLVAIPAGMALVELWDGRRRIWRKAAIAVAAWVIATPVLHRAYLSYFNELGAPWADRILLDSDLDWGQDLGRLEDELAARHVGQVWLAYNGTARLCGHRLPPFQWLPPRMPVTGWVAISKMYRYGVMGRHFRDVCEPHREYWVAARADDYAWLDAYQPVATIGSSILLYQIPASGTAASHGAAP